MSSIINQSKPMTEVHPVLVVTIGTTACEILAELSFYQTYKAAPYRAIAIDTIPYNVLLERLVQNNYSRGQIISAIPRSNYFELVSTFDEKFDFNNPMNAHWRSVIFEHGLERLARQPNAPGAAGTPALGASRVLCSDDALRVFLANHFQELTQVTDQTLSLRPGAIVHVLTTSRGGTGTGATARIAAIIKSVAQASVISADIYLHMLMADIFSGADDKVKANALAMLAELAHFTQDGNFVPLPNNEKVSSVIKSVSLTFGANGHQSLKPEDAKALKLAVIQSYLRPETQSAICAKQVDLTDVSEFDYEGNPTHVCIDHALIIEGLPAEAQDYLTFKLLLEIVCDEQTAFSNWLSSEQLSPEDANLASEVAKSAITDLHLMHSGLLLRLMPANSPANAIRSLVEGFRGKLASLKADAIKSGMPALPVKLQSEFAKFQRDWHEAAIRLGRELTKEISNYVWMRLGDKPHLALSVLGNLNAHIMEVSREADQAAGKYKQQRDAAGSSLAAVLSEVQNAGGILGVFKADEIVRNSAVKGLDVALLAGLARVEQQQNEYLRDSLTAGISIVSEKGQITVAPPVTAILQERISQFISDVQKQYADQRTQLADRLDGIELRISRRSVFHRSIVDDALSLESLSLKVAEVRKLFKRTPGAVSSFLRGEQSLEETASALQPLLPYYSDSQHSLTELLVNDPARFQKVVRSLRGIKPFTPLDPVVEEQQGLNGSARKDRLTIIELPGGKDGVLARMLKEEGLIENLNDVVSSGSDEIRLFYFRSGIPYGALKLLPGYFTSYQKYCSSPSAITPHTVAGAERWVDSLRPSTTNLSMRTEEALISSKILLDRRVAVSPSGEYTFAYRVVTGQNGFSKLKKQSFASFEALHRWVMRHVVTVLKELEGELKEFFDQQPGVYKQRMLEAWRQAAGREREVITRILNRLGIDPEETEDWMFSNRYSKKMKTRALIARRCG